MVFNALSMAGTAYAIATGAYEKYNAVKNVKIAQREKITNSDEKNIHGTFKAILNYNENATNKPLIEIKETDLKHFEIYCKAIGVKDDLNFTKDKHKDTYSINDDKIKAIRNALVKFDESVRDGSKEKLFDVDIDLSKYSANTMGQQTLNFFKNPLGKPSEFLKKSFDQGAEKKAEEEFKKAEEEAKAKNTPDETVKKAEDVKKAKEVLEEVTAPNKEKSERIANNVFMLLQEQAEKCIEAVKSARLEAPFEYKEDYTQDLIINAQKFGQDGTSNLTNTKINTKIKKAYDANTVREIKKQNDLDTMQDGQKISLDYNTFFENGVELSDKQKEYIKKNAQFISVTVKDNDELLNLIEKMNEINSTHAEVNYKKNGQKTASNLNHIDGLIELLKSDTLTSNRTHETHIDYIKQALFLDKQNNTSEKQDLFSSIIKNKKFEEIEKSFPEFMGKIFPAELKRYNHWDKHYLTTEELETQFGDVAKKDFSKIKSYPPQAKTDIIRQFLDHKKFTGKTGKEQFEILNTILQDNDLKDIKAIKEVCEATATEEEGEILQYISDNLDLLKKKTDTDTDTDTDTYDDDDRSVSSTTASTTEIPATTTTSLSLENYSDKAKVKIFEAFLGKNITKEGKFEDDKDKIINLAKTEEFKNIPEIKTLIAKKVQEKKLSLASDDDKKIIDKNVYYKPKDLSGENTPDEDIIKYVANIHNDSKYDKLHQKNSAIANALFKKILGRDERLTNITTDELNMALNWLKLSDENKATKSDKEPKTSQSKKGFFKKFSPNLPNFLKRTPL